jgi:hypothetical protein
MSSNSKWRPAYHAGTSIGVSAAYHRFHNQKELLGEHRRSLGCFFLLAKRVEFITSPPTVCEADHSQKGWAVHFSRLGPDVSSGSNATE